jgi:hypothetical protein
MFGFTTNNENRVFINGIQLPGIESAEFSYSNSYSPSRFLGVSTIHSLVSNDTQKQFSFARYLIYNDPCLQFTGNSPISGSVHYDGKSYGFNSGFLTDYSVNCAVGAIPNVNANFAVYGQMNTGISASGNVVAPTIFIPNQGSISLTCDNVSTNRVVGFDYALKINREPIYTIGSSFPAEVITMQGIEFSASVQIDVDDAFMQNAASFLSLRENKSISFTVRSRDGNTILQQFSIPRASLIGENLTSSADGGVKLTINYAGQV